MTEFDLSKELARTIRHTFGDLLDQPLLGNDSPAPEKGKLTPAQALAEYAERIKFCNNCSLHIGRTNLVFGRGHWEARIAFIGDFPSDADDKNGTPFSDEHGALLNKMILAMKIRPEETYLTNIFKCRAPAGARLEAAQFIACQEHLIFQFTQVRAPVIVALGDHAARALARSESPLRVLRRQVFEWQGRKVICTHHPRDLHNSPQLKKEAWDDLQLAMREMERL